MLLEEMEKVAGICMCSCKEKLKRRFQYATNPSATNFDPIYITGTLLHPGHCELLQTDQEEAGKAHILEIIQLQSQRQTNKVINTTKRAVKALIPLKSLDQKVHLHQHISNTLLHY